MKRFRQYFSIALVPMVMMLLTVWTVLVPQTMAQLPPQPATPPATISYTTISTVAVANSGVLVAAGSGLRYNIVSAACLNATTTGAVYNLKNGTATVMTLPCPANATGDSWINFARPVSFTSTNTAVNVNLPTGFSTAYITLGYYPSR